ncbi:hypothetical protein [Tychonema sp. LEGE 07203]|uniref:hypothetical protein n=1 Tax=Tychonema sp. LEGE 07203 TaxID=1828671 RepID=UPI00187F1689|nr:hypothetical protein [Tychonema sp. LEGE 07203]MBE9096740.1 hypothetical protein [Tychonema sp. LEGE 07203]
MDNIFFNLGDRQHKIIGRQTVLNHKSSRTSLKPCRLCVNSLLVAGAVNADEEMS